MIRFFSTSHPVNILLLFLLGIIIRIPFLISPEIPVNNVLSGTLYAVLNSEFLSQFSSYPILFPLLAYLIIFIQALSLNGFINNQKLFPAPNLLFVLSYIVFTAFIPEWNTLSAQLLVTIVITILIQKMILASQKAQFANDLFILAFITGAASLLYKPSLLLIAVLYTGLLIFRPFRFADWIIVLFGFSLPYYFGLSYLYISDKWDMAASIAPYISFGSPIIFRKSEDIINLLLIAIPVISGFFFARKYAVRMVVLPRKAWAFLSFFLFFGTLFFFAGSVYVFDTLILMMVPLSFFITAFLYYPAVKFFPSLYIWLMVGFLFVKHFL